MRRAAEVLRGPILLLAAAGLALIAWAVAMAQATGSTRPPVRIGNTPEVLAALPAKSPGDSVRLAVLSDIEEGVETFRMALRRFAERPPDFVVLNGDLCYRPTEEGYRYFLWQLRDAAYPGPFLCGAGNHDLVNRTDPSRFRRFFGDDRLAARVGCVQILILNNCVNGLSDADYRWLQAAAAADPAIRHRLLFLHYPPLVAPKDREEVRPSPAYRRLYDLAPSLAIRRVFSGNLHAYRRLRIDGVDYVVCGGGGADRHSPEAAPHYVEVLVEGDRVTDAIIPLPEIHSPVESLDRFACLYVGPWLRRHPLVSVPAVLGAIALLARQAVRTIRRRAPAARRDALHMPPPS